MIRIDTYQHLNKKDPLVIEVDMEDLAKKVEAMNYGTHRFLSALVKIRKQTLKGYQPDKLGNGIEKLLNQGLF